MVMSRSILWYTIRKRYEFTGLVWMRRKKKEKRIHVIKCTTKIMYIRRAFAFTRYKITKITYIKHSLLRLMPIWLQCYHSSQQLYNNIVMIKLLALVRAYRCNVAFLYLNLHNIIIMEYRFSTARVLYYNVCGPRIRNNTLCILAVTNSVVSS